MLGNSITSIFGSGIDETNFRCKDFTYGNLSNIYFNDYNKDSIVFKKFIHNKVVFCDSCQISKISTNKFYHHYNW